MDQRESDEIFLTVLTSGILFLVCMFVNESFNMAVSVENEFFGGSVYN